MLQYTEKNNIPITSYELLDLLLWRVTKYKSMKHHLSHSSFSVSAWLGAIPKVSYPEEGARGPKCVVSQSETLAGDQQYKCPDNRQ